VEILRRGNLPVRALVHREDERADALRAMGAAVVLGDLTLAGDVAGALAGCRRMARNGDATSLQGISPVRSASVENPSTESRFRQKAPPAYRND
jgi:hypothetical protein